MPDFPEKIRLRQQVEDVHLFRDDIDFQKVSCGEVCIDGKGSDEDLSGLAAAAFLRAIGQADEILSKTAEWIGDLRWR